MQTKSETVGIPLVETSGKEKPVLANQTWTFYLVFCNLSIIVGSSLAYGYNLSVINAPFAVMGDFFNESFIRSYNKTLTSNELSGQWSLAVTLYLIGGFVGSIWFPAALVTALGKRNALLANSAIGGTGAIILFITPWTGSHIPFLVGRFVVGFQGGVSMVIAPDLIADQAPARLRGGCGSLYSCGVASGIILTNLFGLNFILGTADLWHFLFAILLGFYVIHAISLIFVVESPTYLLSKGRNCDALTALCKLRCGTAFQVGPELDECSRLLSSEKSIKAVRFIDIFKYRQLWWPMIIVLQMGFCGEMTGLAPACFYATKVLEDGGIDSYYSSLANLCLSVLSLAGLFLSIAVIDRFGRRLLMVVPLCAVCVANVMLIVALTYKIFQLGIAGFALFLFFYGSGPGCLPLYMTAEMVPLPARQIAYSVGMFTVWCSAIAISFIFPAMDLAFKQYSFLPFVIISFVENIFFFFFLPETSSRLVDYDPDRFAPGRSLLQIKRPQKKVEISNNEPDYF